MCSCWIGRSPHRTLPNQTTTIHESLVMWVKGQRREVSQATSATVRVADWRAYPCVRSARHSTSTLTRLSDVLLIYRSPEVRYTAAPQEMACRKHGYNHARSRTF